MAIEKLKPSAIEEVIDVEKSITDASLAYEQAKRLQLATNRKKQEEALVNFKLQLEKQGIAVTEKLQREFLKNFLAVRRAEENKLIRDRFNEEKKRQIEFYKQTSKQAEDERKAQDILLNKELEIAKLRSKVVVDSDGNIVREKTKTEQVFDGLKAELKQAGGKLINGLVDVTKQLSGEINSVISTFAQYQSSINTRLQGTSSTFQSAQRNLTSGLGTSPFVRTSAVLESLSELVSQGIAFNIEQRAFLDSLSDKIATTFDVANSSLLRIVRLQQEDSTASRLGLEAGLTRYFNEMFEDTSYLSQTFDSVTDALVEATSTMGTKQSVEFEYIVQKWLGSLSAVGTSENTVRTLAEAIGFLGAGNVTALNASSMQNLLVMAASRAGLDYSSMLTEGLNAYNTNTLLQAVVGYMQEIGQGSNQVVKSQFAQAFGLSISDLTAASNIATDLDSITANMMSYSGTIDELGFQLNEISSRVSIAEKIQNVMSNIKFSIGQGIAENALMAGTWSIADLIQSVTGGIAIPAVMAAGFGIDMNTTVENLIKTGIVGISTLSKLPDLFTGLATANNFSQMMGTYGIGYDPTARMRTTGTGLGRRFRGLGTSEASIIGSGDAEGIAAFEVMKAKAPAEVQQEQAAKDQKTSNDIFNYLVYLLDPKLSTMTQLLGSMAGFNVGLTSFDNRVGQQSEYILNYGTTVTTSQPVSESQTNKSQMLQDLSDNVSDIHNLLKNGITVNIGTVSSVSSLFSAPGNLTQ